MYFVYIIECKDRTLYTGSTINIEDRIDKHNQGKGCKYTRARYPVVLKYFEEFTTLREALQREYFIKQLSREDKYRLINSNN